MCYVLVMLESSRIPRASPVKHSTYCFRWKVIPSAWYPTGFEIKLARKAVSIEVEVIDAPFYYNLLLGRNWTYAMSSIASVVFRVVVFPHEGKLVTVHQLNFTLRIFLETNESTIPLVDQVNPTTEILVAGMY